MLCSILHTADNVCRMIGMRQQENEAFRRDLEEAASSKVELADQLSDARAEAGSWQHQLAEAREVQDSLKERLRLERTLQQKVEQEVEVRPIMPVNCLITVLLGGFFVGQHWTKNLWCISLPS